MIEVDNNNIHLYDSLAIEDIDIIYNKLSEIPDKDNSLITIDKISEIHMAIIQVLLSFKKTYPNTNFKIEDNNLHDLLEKMGLLKFFL